MGSYPVLYSYRRCPYAMRARLALAFAGYQFEVREISFHNKPQDMLAASPKGTVPVLILNEGRDNQYVIEESLDIVLYAENYARTKAFSDLLPETREEAEMLYTRLHSEFIPALNRYKYPDRYTEDPFIQAKGPLAYREKCLLFLVDCENKLSNQKFLFGDVLSIYDILLFPFVRQFQVVNRDWFDQYAELALIKQWMNWFFDHPLYKAIMPKLKPWLDTRDDELVLFPYDAGA